VRMALYMGAIVANRFNPVIRSFYQRLYAADTAKKVSLVACMRKLLVILNAMLKHRTPWQPHEVQPAWQSRQLLSLFLFRAGERILTSVLFPSVRSFCEDS